MTPHCQATWHPNSSSDLTSKSSECNSETKLYFQEIYSHGIDFWHAIQRLESLLWIGISNQHILCHRTHTCLSESKITHDTSTDTKCVRDDSQRCIMLFALCAIFRGFIRGRCIYYNSQLTHIWRSAAFVDFVNGDHSLRKAIPEWTSFSKSWYNP